ncbi:hypothetical protein DRV85_10805 [Rhodosalinus halophilus]|uniref:Uncharacterized protein n=1 Tax=Rhodosalinus halophilus TaxID=2259333 RepID=A0A365UA64_9RHOB|nr:hypothetical protein [Rhodosalinus halophilus]RBI85134.1 hypothetical protein DRV85_10805 [Rhodosalinus halophilus]
MPVSFQILPVRGLVYVRYEGFARIAESAELFARYMAHPDFAPGQKQLVDLAGVTGIEADFPKLLGLQARKAEAFLPGGVQTMIVYHAPGAVSRRMAEMVRRSWSEIPSVVPVVVESEVEALEVLGLRERRFAEILQTA